MTARGVLVTGGARGIGRAIVEMFLAEGDYVVSLDVDQGEDGGADEQLVNIVGSSTDRARVFEAAQLVVQEAGALNVAVCSAGIVRYVPFLDLDDETWRQHLDVDLTGTFVTAQTAARQMKEQGGGSIVLITSISAERPSRTQGHYCVAKAGAQMLSDAMAWELAEFRVRVNTVGPGWIETRMTSDYLRDPQLRKEVEATVPLGRVGQPRDVAEAVRYLTSEAASYVTGAHVRVDGGLIVGKDKT